MKSIERLEFSAGLLCSSLRAAFVGKRVGEDLCSHAFILIYSYALAFVCVCVQ